MSDFRYHYLLVSLYVFAILIVIIETDLKNKIIYVLYKVFFILSPNYLKILSYTIY
jgi:hypothetical protein